VGAYYYLRIVKVMYFDDGGEQLGRVRQPVQGTLIFLSAFAVSPLGYLLIGPLQWITDRAAGSIF
jgi:NADH-quinone oxidoreductase subunit N